MNEILQNNPSFEPQSLHSNPYHSTHSRYKLYHQGNMTVHLLQVLPTSPHQISQWQHQTVYVLKTNGIKRRIPTAQGQAHPYIDFVEKIHALTLTELIGI